MYKLYKIINLINGHCYVGMTKTSLNRRFRAHKTSAKNIKLKSKLYDAMRKYGVDNFIIELISIYNTIEECWNEEINTISKIGYYNIAKGGGSHFTIQDVKLWKDKLKTSRKGRTPSLGMKHTEENKKLFKKVSQEYWQNVDTYDWNLFKHLSYKEAKLQYGVSTTHYYRLKKRFETNDLK